MTSQNEQFNNQTSFKQTEQLPLYYHRLSILDTLITMSATLIARASSPVLQAARKNFSTTTPFLKTLTSEGALPAASSTKWRWSNLSPRTRRYILVGLAVGTCVDTYVVYNYWPRIFGSE